MADFTSRLGLIKPAGGEDRAVGPINTNSDRLDYIAGCILVNDGATPSDSVLFDGAIVREKTSGKIWEARKQLDGTFQKVWIRYPCHFVAEWSGTISAGSATTYTTWGELNNVSLTQCKNSGSSNLVSGRFVVPVKGLWQFWLTHQWAANGSGIRGTALNFNNTVFTAEFETLQLPNTLFTHVNSLKFTNICDVGDTVCAAGWQNSGGSLNLIRSTIRASLIEPVQ